MRYFFADVVLDAGNVVQLAAEVQHRLGKVLRLGAGERVALFNGRDGLWEATLGEKARTAEVLRCLKPQPAPALPPFALALCVPKREAWESALRQATEMGVDEIFPLLSARCVPTRLNEDRARELVREAAEQCERLTLPMVHPMAKLADWLAARHAPVAWAYERLEGAFSPPTARCLLVGPEGGFDPAEVALLRGHAAVEPLDLGPTILRVDTAVVAGLATLTCGR